MGSALYKIFVWWNSLLSAVSVNSKNKLECQWQQITGMSVLMGSDFFPLLLSFFLVCIYLSLSLPPSLCSGLSAPSAGPSDEVPLHTAWPPATWCGVRAHAGHLPLLSGYILYTLTRTPPLPHSPLNVLYECREVGILIPILAWV